MSTGFDRADGDGLRRGERALVVLPDRSSESNARTTDARLDEAAGLAEAISLDATPYVSLAGFLSCSGHKTIKSGVFHIRTSFP